jgi:hypothetical protein
VRPVVSRDESGQIAGVEAVALGMLVFVVGMLLVANAWAVIDAKMAVAGAAREAARAYVEAPPGVDPLATAEEAGREALRGAGRDPAKLQLTPLEGDFARCRRVTFSASYPVPAVTVPWVGGYGQAFTASARHSEVVDPYRSGVPLSEERCDTLAP